MVDFVTLNQVNIKRRRDGKKPLTAEQAQSIAARSSAIDLESLLTTYTALGGFDPPSSPSCDSSSFSDCGLAS